MTSQNISMPGFLAEESLRPSQTHFRTKTIFGFSQTGLLTPQRFTLPNKGKCWCSEPDLKTVCTSAGVCHEVPVCLQYSCPGSNEYDDPGDYFGN